jgi:hypothetical protein
MGDGDLSSTQTVTPLARLHDVYVLYVGHWDIMFYWNGGTP